MHITDELINGIVNSDTKTENCFYEEYYQKIKGFIIKRYGNYDDIEDDISEILTKIFKKIKSYNSEKSSFDSWVFTIAKYHMVDKWRVSKDVCEVSYTELDYLQPQTMSLYENFEDENYFSHITSSLTPVDSTLINMKYIQGFTYEEIGQEFNWTSSTASNKVNYIMSKLKKENKEDNPLI